MTILRYRVPAHLAATGFHALEWLTGDRIASKQTARLPEFQARRTPMSIPTSIGAARATLYRPADVASPGIYVNVHGGGFVLGFAAMDDPLCRAMAAQSGCAVLNLEYVLAPRHPFPDAVRQVFEAVSWVSEHGAEYGWDGSRLAVGGQSAGGSLAASCARLAWEGGGPSIALQVLHYPVLDMSGPRGAKRRRVPLPAGRRPVVPPWMGDMFDTCYLPDATARTDRLVSPAGPTDTADLRGLAPALVLVAEYDTLRGEAERYAHRLDRVGALAELRVIPGADHGYDVADDDRARRSYALMARHVRTALG